MRVLIAGGGTGGHLMPALALARMIRDSDPSVEPVLVGARRGVEAEILPGRPFRHYLLSAEPLYRRTWWRNLRWPFLAARVMRECRELLDREQPALAVGTGGYAAGPVLWAALRRGIPVALQEQNAMPGLTTRWLSRWASQIHLGFPEAASRLRAGRDTTVFTFGNPIVPPEPVPPEQARLRLSLPRDAPVLLVMGGSQGARVINEVLAALIEAPELSGVAVLWSTGPAHFPALHLHHRPPWRQVRPFWDPIGEAYAAADLVIGRSGAMTVAELCAWGLPSILIPYAAAAAGHQAYNAGALERAGAAVSLSESTLTAAALGRLIQDLLRSPQRREGMARAARSRGRPDATGQIVRAMLAGLTAPASLSQVSN